MYDVIVIGGGPAGVAAGVYAARKRLKTLLMTEAFGGQSIVSDSIENWVGDVQVSGFDLAQRLERHLRRYEDGPRRAARKRMYGPERGGRHV